MWRKCQVLLPLMLVATAAFLVLTSSSQAMDIRTSSPSVLSGPLASQLSSESAGSLNIVPLFDAPSGAVMEVQGSYAYLALGTRLQILDVSHPTDLQVVGELDVSAEVTDIEVLGDRLYLTNSIGMHIINIANPARPYPLGIFATPSPQPYPGFDAIEATEEAVYLSLNASSTSLDYRIALIDVRDPYHPVQVGEYLSVPDGSVKAVGTYAYIYHVGSLDKYIAVYDMSNPAAPVLISVTYVDLLSWEVSDNYMLLTVLKWKDHRYDGSEFQVVDISDPRHPTLVGSYRDTAIMRGVARRGDYVYVGSDQELLILDVSDLTHPVKAGSYHQAGSIVNAIENHAYVYDRNTGLIVMDISVPPTMTPVGAYYFTQDVITTVATDDYAYMAHLSGLWTLDTSDLPHLAVAGQLLTALPSGLEIRDTLAYFAAEGGFGAQQSLRLVDLSNPLAPVELGRYETGFDAYPFTPHIVPIADYVYYAPGSEYIAVLDTSDPTTPVYANSLRVPGLREMVATDGVLYLADEDELHVADLSDPAQPSLTHSVAISGTQDLVVAGQRLYGLTARHLHIWNISVPMTPTEIAVLDTGGISLALEGRYAYISSDSGVQVLDLSVINMPVTVGHAQLTGFHVFARDSVIYLSRGWHGLSVARFTGVSEAFAPDQGGILIYTDTHGLLTEIQVPTHAFTSTTVLLYSPSPTQTKPSGWAPTQHTFQLSAFATTGVIGDMDFVVPLTVTVHYSDVDVALVADEAQLAILRWNGDGWRDPAADCGPVARDTSNNWLSAPLCRTGIYALVGPAHQVFMPYTALYTR